MLDPDRSNPPLDENSLPAPSVELSDAEVDALVSSIAPRVQKENERINKELNLLAERAQVTADASGAAIALLSADALICRGRAGTPAPVLGTRLDLTSGLAGECVRTGGILLCDDPETDERVDVESCRARGINSILAVPLYYKGEVIGIFEVFSPERQAFGHEDIAVLQTMAEMAVGIVHPVGAQQAGTETAKASAPKPEIIAASPPRPLVPGQAGPQDLGIDLSKLIVEPEDRPVAATESQAGSVLQFPAVPPKRPPQSEEFAPFHDPEDDLVCELGPQNIAELVGASERMDEPKDAGLALFHPAEEQEPRRPAVSRKLIIAAGIVVAIALIWLKFCNHAQTAAPESQSEAPTMEAPAAVAVPVQPAAPAATMQPQPKHPTTKSRARTKPHTTRTSESGAARETGASYEPKVDITVEPVSHVQPESSGPPQPTPTVVEAVVRTPVQPAPKPFTASDEQSAPAASPFLNLARADSTALPLTRQRQSPAEQLADLRQAAEEGNPQAQLALAVRYADGTGVPQDYFEAVRWFTLAAAQGVAPTSGKPAGAWKRTSRWLREHERQLAQNR